MQLAEMKRDEDYHFRKTRSSNSTYHWEMYRKLRNYTNHEEKKSQIEMFLSDDWRRQGWWFLWKKQVLPDTKKSTVSSIFENGKWHTENLSVAKIMNQYFVSVGKVLAKPFQKVSTVFTSSTPLFTWIMLNVNLNPQNLTKLLDLS